MAGLVGLRFHRWARVQPYCDPDDSKQDRCRQMWDGCGPVIGSTLVLGLGKLPLGQFLLRSV